MCASRYAGNASAAGAGGAAPLSESALIDLQNAAAQATFETAVMEACPHCGRTFKADRLAIHLRSCTAEKPSRPVGSNHLSDESASPLAKARPKTSLGATAASAAGHVPTKLRQRVAQENSADEGAGQR